MTQDHLGSTRVITNNLGQVIKRSDYMAYGDEVITANRSSANGYEQPSETRKGYTGYERDIESGLDFAQARFYNPNHGRFTSVDPLTASANVKDPQTFNRYTYALNSPYKFTDPLGLISSSTGANGAWCSMCQTVNGDTGGFADLAVLSNHDNSGNSGESARDRRDDGDGVTPSQQSQPPAGPDPRGCIMPEVIVNGVIGPRLIDGTEDNPNPPVDFNAFLSPIVEGGSTVFRVNYGDYLDFSLGFVYSNTGEQSSSTGFTVSTDLGGAGSLEIECFGGLIPLPPLYFDLLPFTVATREEGENFIREVNQNEFGLGGIRLGRSQTPDTRDRYLEITVSVPSRTVVYGITITPIRDGSGIRADVAIGVVSVTNRESFRQGPPSPGRPVRR